MFQFAGNMEKYDPEKPRIMSFQMNNRGLKLDGAVIYKSKSTETFVLELDCCLVSRRGDRNRWRVLLKPSPSEEPHCYERVTHFERNMPREHTIPSQHKPLSPSEWERYSGGDSASCLILQPKGNASASDLRTMKVQVKFPPSAVQVHGTGTVGNLERLHLEFDTKAPTDTVCGVKYLSCRRSKSDQVYYARLTVKRQQQQYSFFIRICFKSTMEVVCTMKKWLEDDASTYKDGVSEWMPSSKSPYDFGESTAECEFGEYILLLRLQPQPHQVETPIFRDDKEFKGTPPESADEKRKRHVEGMKAMVHTKPIAKTAGTASPASSRATACHDHEAVPQPVGAWQ
ncbi:uncharacterized protein PG998_015130 [Apiospora kogelbergensis]|uniref:uncharacterized protein n=1 Tax=Apiospora kogelbergensis TaxID=1337665 RepID=UPI00313206FF